MIFVDIFYDFGRFFAIRIRIQLTKMKRILEKILDSNTKFGVFYRPEVICSESDESLSPLDNFCRQQETDITHHSLTTHHTALDTPLNTGTPVISLGWIDDNTIRRSQERELQIKYETSCLMMPLLSLRYATTSLIKTMLDSLKRRFGNTTRFHSGSRHFTLRVKSALHAVQHMHAEAFKVSRQLVRAAFTTFKPHLVYQPALQI